MPSRPDLSWELSWWVQGDAPDASPAPCHPSLSLEGQSWSWSEAVAMCPGQRQSRGGRAQGRASDEGLSSRR